MKIIDDGIDNNKIFKEENEKEKGCCPDCFLI